MLEKSINENNLQDGLNLIRAGMSDHTGEAELNINPNSELNSLYGEGRKETIRLMTLDGVIKDGLIPADCRIDFIKLDAEGEELKVLQGGKKFFKKHSPLVMFEIKHGNTYNHGLVQAFKDLGMDIYRLVPGLNILVPFDEEKPMDGYQLNLFACIKKRAAILKEQGLLVYPEVSFKAHISIKWQDFLKPLPYAQPLYAKWNNSDKYADNPFWEKYQEVLNTYLSSLDESRTIQERFALLGSSREQFADLKATGDSHISTTLALIRIHAELGERSSAVKLTNELIQAMNKGLQITLNRPFIPPINYFDYREVKGDLGKWLQAAIFEALEKRRTFSSYFHNDLQILKTIFQNPNHSMEMERRLALAAMRQGKNVTISRSSTLVNLADNSHLNRKAWSIIGGVESTKSKLPYNHIFCAGMQRSGSTWSYNVARLLLYHHIGQNNLNAGYVGEGVSVDTAITNHTDIEKILLLKFHQHTSKSLLYASQRKARVIYTHRPPMNALASLTDFFKTPFEHAVKAIKQSLITMEKWISTNHVLLVSFDNLVNSPEQEIKRIADFLDIPAQESLITSVSKQTSYSEMKKNAEELKNHPEKLIKAGNSAYDPVTLLHVGHSPKGKSRDWKVQFSPEQQQYAFQHLSPWVDEQGSLKIR